MEWTPQQNGALAAVDAWLKTSEPVFRLFGYAGTGKTTLARHLAQNVNGRVFFGAYTGKAALVLRQKGCNNASTIHSMIYRSREEGRVELEQLEEELKQLLARDGDPREALKLQRQIRALRVQLSTPKFSLKPRDSCDLAEASLLVIDECSMIDESMGYDLLSFKVKILVLGDPAQLPPIRGGGFFTEAEPDVMLTDVQRQARDNPIIDLATRVREGRRLELGSYGESAVIDRSAVDLERVLQADQLLCGLNVTRRASNARLRHALGRDNLVPVEGDRLVCLRNERELGLLNGGLFESVSNSTYHEETVQLSIKSTDTMPGEPEAEKLNVTAHLGPFLGENIEMPWWERRAAQEFDFGYALTVHKAQGSQWNDVVVLDEWTRPETHKRWLYTAITRAAEKICIVQY